MRSFSFSGIGHLISYLYQVLQSSMSAHRFLLLVSSHSVLLPVLETPSKAIQFCADFGQCMYVYIKAHLLPRPALRHRDAWIVYNLKLYRSHSECDNCCVSCLHRTVVADRPVFLPDPVFSVSHFHISRQNV